MEARKLKEGEAAMAAGAKCKKTSLLGRWKPDWEAAAAEYERAATCFKVGKAYARAIDAYVGASEAHTQVEGQNYMAAKHLESAGFLARDLKEAAKAAQLYEQAAKFHEADGRRDNAAEAYCKAARVLEGADDARAAALLEEACALPDDEDEVGKLAAFVEVFKTAVALLLRTGQPGAAAPLLRQQAALHARLQQPHAVARCELSAVVALLAADDFQSAREPYDQGDYQEAVNRLESLVGGDVPRLAFAERRPRRRELRGVNLHDEARAPRIKAVERRLRHLHELAAALGAPTVPR